MMNKTSLLIAAMFCTAAPQIAAAELTLLNPGVQDSVPSRLNADAPKRAGTMETEALRYSWRLDDAAALSAVAEPQVTRSKEYWDTRSAAEMASGIDLPTTSPGAIVRLSPVAGASAKALEARRVILSKDGQSYSNGSGMQALADSDELSKGAASFAEGSSVFRIDPALGHGNFKLQLPQATGDTIVHVFEPQSLWQLELKSDRIAYAAGGKIRIDTWLRNEQTSVGVDEITGLIVSPDGQTREFNFRANKDGGYSAEIQADFVASDSPALFEIHAFASAKDKQTRVLRDARAAFAFAAPGARFAGGARNAALKSAQSISVELDVEVARASRYQVGGVLYGSFKDGSLRPIAMAQSAMLMQPGVQSITLEYSAESLANTKAGAPFEVRDLQLVDQANMGLQEQRVRALVFDAAD